MIGRKLAHYEITAKLGEGGMGEVWKATDTKLGREVAIKVLPEAFSQDEERLGRFEREAKVLASLNHPHIASIYGLEEADGVRALVLELVEGPTLGERLAEGRPSLDESVAIARQIAEALEDAHEKGIVHRDLKPANVKLTPAGKVKVLDFGLAKALDPLAGSDSSPSQLAHSPTLTLGATIQGVILGTAAYMSPEQARGAVADRRSDVWAFGVVLFEMLSGKALFAEPTVSDTLASVLKVDPDLDKLPADVPGKLRRLLERCLRKNPKERLHSISDARIVLEEIERGDLDEPVAAASVGTVAPRPLWQTAAIAGAALAVGAAIAFVAARATTPARPPERVVRFDIPQPPDLPFVGAPKISPDGKHIAFTARDDKGMRIWVRSLDSAEARPLQGTEGTTNDGRPFWSPDSRYLGFFTADQLKKVPIDGGPPQKIADHGGADGSWSENGTILFDFSRNDPIFGVPASGGVARAVVSISEDEPHQLAWPQFLPGGEKFLYVVYGGSEEQNGIWMANADGSDRRRVVPGLSRVEYAPPGWILFVRESTLVAQRFDVDQGALVGEPIPVADGLGVSSVGLAEFSVSREGVLAYRAVGGSEEELTFHDLRGGRDNAPVVAGNLNHPTFSPDGRWLAYDDRSEAGGRDIWLRDLKRGVSSRFTFSDRDEAAPLFSPDGERLLFARFESEGVGSEIVSRPLAAGAEKVVGASHDGTLFPSAISPDGRTLVAAVFSGAQPDLVTIDLERGGEPTPLISTPGFREFRTSFSPDGRWLAIQSDESGQEEIYVQPFPGPGRKWQVSTAGGYYPIWSPRGGTIFFWDADQFLNRVSVQAGASFDAGVPEKLFRLGLAPGASMRKIAITPDGERFLALLQAGAQATTPTSVVVGWDAALPEN